MWHDEIHTPESIWCTRTLENAFAMLLIIFLQPKNILINKVIGKNMNGIPQHPKALIQIQLNLRALTITTGKPVT